MRGGVLTQLITKLRRQRRNHATPSRKAVQVFLVGEFGIRRGRGRRVVFGGEEAFGFHKFIIYDNYNLS